jgi:drug/metabolite transporter (DMT)-like permease
VAVETLPPLLMAGSRYLVAGGLVLALAHLRGHELPGRREWLLSVPLGVLMFLVGNGLVVIAEQTLPSSVAATVCAATPLVATAIGAARGNRPGARELVGMVLGFVGVVVLAGRSLAVGGLGVGSLVFLAPLGWGLGSVIAKQTGLTSFACAGAQMVAGGVAMLLLGAVLGERLPPHVALRSALAWTYLVVLGSVVGYSAYLYVLRHARPSVALSYAYVNPILAVALGATVGGERLGPEIVVAAALIAVGVASSVLGRPRAS